MCLLQTFQNCRLFLVRLFPRNWELPNLRQCEPQDMLRYFLCLNFTSRMLFPTLSALDSFPAWFSGCFTCFGTSIPPSPGLSWWAAKRSSKATVPHPPSKGRGMWPGCPAHGWTLRGSIPAPGSEHSPSAPLVSQAAATQREFWSCLYARIPAFYRLWFHL